MLLRLAGKGKRSWRNGRKTATAGKAVLQTVLLLNPAYTGVNTATRWHLFPPHDHPNGESGRKPGACAG